MPIVRKVKAVGIVAIVYAALLAIQAAAGALPSSPWEVAIEAGIAPVIAFVAGYLTPASPSQ